MNKQEVAVVKQAAPPVELSVDDVLAQVQKIQRFMGAAMHEGEHYGKIPGCGPKPVLLKPGAEKLALMFRLCPSFQITPTELGEGQREYMVVCTITHIPSGQVYASGVGSCSTKENKYRFRWDSTGNEVPSEYWKDRDPALLGGHEFVPRKIGGKWFIHRRVEHDNPADYYNTALKMAKKRAQVDATLTATAASDCFTQDLEDMPQQAPVSEPTAKPKATPPPEQEMKKSLEDAINKHRLSHEQMISKWTDAILSYTDVKEFNRAIGELRRGPGAVKNKAGKVLMERAHEIGFYLNKKTLQFEEGSHQEA